MFRGASNRDEVELVEEYKDEADHERDLPVGPVVTTRYAIAPVAQSITFALNRSGEVNLKSIVAVVVMSRSGSMS